MNKVRPFVWFVLLASLCSSAAFAQLTNKEWPKPADTPNTPVQCATVACANWVVGWPQPPIKRFTGRYIDSSYVQEHQLTFRTARARGFKLSPDRKRLYVHLGSAIGAYSTESFFSRLEAREPLWSALNVPVTPSTGFSRPEGAELFLKWDAFFYAEYTNSGFETTLVDGQDRLPGFDVDDRGNVYLALGPFGWGIVTDDGGTSGALMRRRFSQFPTGKPTDLGSPSQVQVVKNSAGNYYAVIADGPRPNIWNVTNVDNPIRQADLQVNDFIYGVKSADRYGALGSAGSVYLYTIDGLVRGDRPQTITAPTGYRYSNIATDGKYFFLAMTNSQETQSWVQVYAPTVTGGTEYAQVASVPMQTGADGFNIAALQEKDGYLAVTGVRYPSGGSGGFDVVLFRVASTTGALTEIDLQRYFYKFYAVNTSDGTRSYEAPHTLFQPSMPLKVGTKLYLLFAGYRLGDVYEIDSPDSVNVALSGAAGARNSFSPVSRPTSQTVYYGDKVRVRPSSSNTMSVTVNFGNTEAANIPGADANVRTGVSTNQDVDHQYSGLTTLTASKTVTVTESGGSSSATTVAFTAPTARVGIANAQQSLVRYLTALPNASGVPVLTTDYIVDGSDGDNEGHVSIWSRDGGTPIVTAPATPLAVGTCGEHTLGFTARYGPYGGDFTPKGGSAYDLSDLKKSFPTFKYVVGPLAAALVTEPAFTVDGSGNLIFQSASRFSSDVTASAIAWDWALVTVDSTGKETVVSGGQGPTGTGMASLTSWAVAGSKLSGTRDLRVRLKLTAPSTTGSCAQLTSVAYSDPLNGPDPVLSPAACSSGCASAMSFAVSSASGVNMVADKWQYTWTVEGTSPVQGLSGSPAFTPPFATSGTYTVRVTVKNDIGSTTLSYGPFSVTITAPVCRDMTAFDVFPTWQNASRSCLTAGGCRVGDVITFAPQWDFTRYSFDCAKNATYTWNFGDGSGLASGESVTHTYNVGNASGYTVTMTVNGVTTQPYIASKAIAIGSGGGNPNPNPEPTCGTMTSSNVIISYHNNDNSCPGSRNCTANEGLSFNLTGGFNFSCGSPVVTWNFGDGGQMSGMFAAHTYAATGPFTVQATVVLGSQTFTASLPITIGPGTTPNPGNPSCEPLTSLNAYIVYTDNKGCLTATGGGPGSQCKADQAITFSAGPGYNYECATHTFEWTFGDGDSAIGQNVQHIYKSSGSYNVGLKITRSGQAPFTANSKPILISGGIPQKPAPAVALEPHIVSSWNVMRFVPVVTPEDAKITNYEWSVTAPADSPYSGSANFVDGKPQYFVTFSKAGTYTIQVAVTQDDGQKASATKTVVVTSPRMRPSRR